MYISHSVYISATAVTSGNFWSSLMMDLVIVVAIVIAIISVIIVAAHRKKDEEKDAMKLFEDLKNNDFENEDKK